jgi:hypothetical protein
MLSSTPVASHSCTFKLLFIIPVVPTQIWKENLITSSCYFYVELFSHEIIKYSSMKSTATELEQIINQHLSGLKNITEEEFSYKPSPGKWSKKEILGHLIDSAQSNIRRFIVAQYEENPSIRYSQDQWVTIAGYQQWETADIINLWYLLNKQICHILRNTPEAMYQRTSMTESLHTIEWLAADYVKHLKHHLHIVLNLDPIAYP